MIFNTRPENLFVCPIGVKVSNGRRFIPILKTKFQGEELPTSAMLDEEKVLVEIDFPIKHFPNTVAVFLSDGSILLIPKDCASYDKKLTGLDTSFEVVDRRNNDEIIAACIDADERLSQSF